MINDVLTVFNLILKAIFNIGDLNFGQLAKSLVDTLQIKKPENVLALELVFNPLFIAINRLVIDRKGHFDSFLKMKDLDTKVKNDATTLVIVLDESFFVDATKMEFLEVVKSSLEQYLPEAGFFV